MLSSNSISFFVSDCKISGSYIESGISHKLTGMQMLRSIVGGWLRVLANHYKSSFPGPINFHHSNSMFPAHAGICGGGGGGGGGGGVAVRDTKLPLSLHAMSIIIISYICHV